MTPTPLDVAALCETLANAREHLLGLRGEHGHWEGELSTSALSTATAVCAIDAYRRASEPAADEAGQLDSLVAQGRTWLAEHQNPDGGWGDTTRSFSNISTTALGWAALAGCEDQFAAADGAAKQWLERVAGCLEPAAVAEAVRRRYGKDRTFSVPILTTLALTGRLGNEREAWRHVPQLPFELAACPHRWFARLKLPVVSFALPALIAIGQVRHRWRPTRNPLARAVRQLARERTLRVLESIQPASGGFLEATPLTSFVVLSLVGAGQAEHPVVRRGIEFITRSVRADGSWPIDTNLATWVTTLSINALGRGESEIADAGTLRRWLVDQQYRFEHPYTHAAPGGWAWTDLSGGVPDADDTPGALLALRHLDDGSAEVRQAARAGVRWLLDLQNGDGGIPTFCRGWGTLPFDRSSADLTAHSLRAWLAWSDAMLVDLQDAMRHAAGRAVVFLGRTQRSDGAWAPLWFGNQHAEDDVNLTYGTGRVLLALAALCERGELLTGGPPDAARAVEWLACAQNEDGGWGGVAGAPPSIEETAVAVEALSAVLAVEQVNERLIPVCDREAVVRAVCRGVAWLIEATDRGRCFPAAPIGFYFAKLWYFEQLYPVSFAVAALGRALAVSRQLAAADGVLAGADG